jgi:hypothetical protein
LRLAVLDREPDAGLVADLAGSLAQVELDVFGGLQPERLGARPEPSKETLGGVFWKWLRLARMVLPATRTGPPTGRVKVTPSGAARIQVVGACMNA